MRKRRRRHPPFPLFYQTNTKNFLIITQDEEDDDGDFKVHKKSDKQIVGGKVLDTFEDETLSCRDCAEDFVFTSGEQEFYASKGWENKPTRCEACKMAKKARFGEDKPKCYAYERGECTRGENCRFSHGSEPTYGGGGGGGGSGVLRASKRRVHQRRFVQVLARRRRRWRFPTAVERWRWRWRRWWRLLCVFEG